MVVRTDPARNPFCERPEDYPTEQHDRGRLIGTCAGCGAWLLAPGSIRSGNVSTGATPSLRWLALRRYSEYGTANATADIRVCENCEVEVRPRSHPSSTPTTEDSE